MKKILAILLAVLMLSSSFALAEEVPGWMKPYDETVTLTFGRDGSAKNPQFPEGESIDNNYYVQWIKDQFNIELKNEWLIETDYPTKVNLAMTTGEFPDLFRVSGTTAKLQLRQLIDAGYLADLSPYFEDHASDLYKDIIDSYGGMDAVFGPGVRGEDGGIYALTATTNGGEYDFVWIRTDWLEKVGMEKPTTIAELVDVARAFQAAKLGGENTVGIEISNKVYSGYNQTDSPSHIFFNYNAYPGNWILDEETGKYVYGTVQEEVKPALQFLADLYAEGIIDKEFATKDFKASLAAGNSGIMFGPWWMGAWPLNDSKANDPSAMWEPIYIPHDDGLYHAIAPSVDIENSYWVASADCEHPEVLIKMANICAEQQNLYNIEKYDPHPKNIPQDVDTHYNDTEYTFDWGSWPVNIKIRYFDMMERLAVVWLDLVAEEEAGNETPVFNTESFDAKAIVAYKNGKNLDSVNGMHVYGKTLGLEMVNQYKDKFVNKTVLTPAPTSTMELAWTSLQDMEQQVLTQIIMGEQPVDYFDTFVANWMAQGGEMITEEVNEQVFGE